MVTLPSLGRVGARREPRWGVSRRTKRGRIWLIPTYVMDDTTLKRSWRLSVSKRRK